MCRDACRRQHNIDLSATNNIYNYRNAFDTHAMHTGNMTVRVGVRVKVSFELG